MRWQFRQFDFSPSSSLFKIRRPMPLDAAFAFSGELHHFVEKTALQSQMKTKLVGWDSL